jgi:biopolymer transport protein ExbD
VPEHKTPSETLAVLAVAAAVASPEVQVELPAKETPVAKGKQDHLIQTVFG